MKIYVFALISIILLLYIGESIPQESNNRLTSKDITRAEFENLLDKYLSGEINDQELNRIVGNLKLGESYDDAQKGWSRFFQRSAQRIVSLPQEWAEAARDGLGPEHLQDLTDQHGIGLGAAAWVGEIAHGSTVGMEILIKELLLGPGDLADAIEAAATIVPAARIGNAVKVARAIKKIRQADPSIRVRILAEASEKSQQEMLRRIATGDTTSVKYRVYTLDDLQLTADEVNTMRQLAASDRRWEFLNSVLEDGEIAFNPDEILQTVAGGEAAMTIRNKVVNEVTPESLELARKLRERNVLIHCRAVVEYENRLLWQPFNAIIPPNAINLDGYVEEVWIEGKAKKSEIDGDTYLVLSALPSSIYTGKAWIDRFELSPQDPTLRPSLKLSVKYFIEQE